MHELPAGIAEIGESRIASAGVLHPGFTVGYPIASPHATPAYLPDHEPALGARRFPPARDWTSGFDLAEGVDLLIHDAQYGTEEYADRVGWGHSAVEHTFAFAHLAAVRRLVTFHHDPAHRDADVDHPTADAVTAASAPFTVTAGSEGAVFDLERRS